MSTALFETNNVYVNML